MIVIDRKAPWIHELAWSASFHAELGHSGAVSYIIAREYLRSMIIRIDDEQETSMTVERQTSWKSEHAISIAIFHDANRELDSSISIKSIASHIFQCNLSKRQGDARETPTKQRATNQTNQSTKEQRTAPTSHPAIQPPSLIVACSRDFILPTTPTTTRAPSRTRQASKQERERERARRQYRHHHQRNEKTSNKSSFGIIDIAEDSSTSDRIIVIVDTACFIHDGAYRWRSGRHVNVSASH